MMGNQYKRLFNSIAPIKSDEELLKAVLDRKAEKNMSPKKKFSKKAILIPAAAAALLGTTAIGVSAAYQWNLPAAFEDMFRDRFEQYNGTSDVKTKNVMFDFSVIGKELDLTYNFDNFDVVIKGIAADEHSAYLLYDVVFAEDYDYALDDGEEWALNLKTNVDMSWVMNYSGEMNPSVEWINGLINMERNTAHCFSTVNIAGISLQDKPLVYSFDSLVRSGGDKKDILELEETKFSVDLDFYLSGNSVKLRPNESVTLAGGETGTINYIGLSTFGVELNVEWDDGQIADENKGNMCEKLKNSITINYKDGTTSDNTAFTANYVDGSGSRFGSLNDSYSSGVLLSWVYPVYMRDIESITIGDKTYNVQSACNAAPFDFASIGKELNRVYEFDNYTLNVRGLITDGYSAYIVADVVFDEDFDYAPKDGWYDWELSIDSDLPGGSGVPSIVNGNTYTFYHKVGTIDNTTLRGKTVTFNFERLERWAHFHGSEKDEIAEIPESEKLDCGVTLDVDFDFDVTRGNKTVIGSTPIYLSELFGSGTLTEFTVTPLGIKATVENSDIESAISIKAEYNDFDLVLYHADGTMTLVEGFGRLDEGTLYLAGNFEYPLDTSDIVGAKIGDVEVDISAAKFAKTSSVEQTAPAFDFSSVGKAIGESFEGLGYTLTVNGVVADAHTAHFIYTIEFNDKFPLDYKHTDVTDTGWFDWGVSGFDLTVNGEKANIGCSYDSNSTWLDENTLQNSFMIFCDNDTSFENSDLTLTIGSLRRTCTGIPDNDVQEIDCGMTVDFSLGEMSGMELDLTPDKTFALDGIGNVTISKVNITPFKLTCTILSADEQKVSFEDFFKAVVNGDSGVSVTLKNGTKISAPGITGVQKVGGIECDMELSYPVNPADVASITICGREIDLLYSGEAIISDMTAIKGKIGENIEHDGFTVRFDNPFVDNYSIYIPYTIKFDNDFINDLDFKEKTIHNGYGEWVLDGEVINGKGDTCDSVIFSDIADDNTAAGVIQIFPDNLSGDSLTIKISSIYRDVKMDEKTVDTQTVYCNTMAELKDISPNTPSLTNTKKTNITLAIGSNAVLKRVEVTPTNIVAMVISPENAMSADEIERQIMQEQNTYVTLKDGTINRISTVWGRSLEDGSVLCTVLLYNEKGMLDLADVESVTVCGHEIDLTGTAATKPVKYDFSQLDGKELNQTIKGNGFTLTLDKVVADVHNAYILYTLEFDEDTNYASGTPSNWSFNFKARLDGKERSGAVGNTIPYLEDGVLKGSFRLTYSEYDLTDSTITLSFNSLNYNRTTLSPLEEKHIGFIETVDIVMDFDLRASETLTLTPNIKIEADGVTAVLSEIEVTPFGMNYTVDLPEELADEDFDVFREAVGKVQEALDNPEYGSRPIITFDDGSIDYDLITSGTGSIGSTITNEHPFTRPVDTSTIKSITFGAYTVDVH